MNQNCRIYLSNSHDPWFNLAMEDWLLHDMQLVDQVLFLWRNDNTVVIGRSQNPWVECQLEKMQTNGVKLARRQSGGGAVFHDLGNTNFTFLSQKKQYDKKRNLQMIIDALSRWSLSVTAQGRNDLVVTTSDGQPRKISGSAFKEKADRAFHHGTMLLNADLTALAQYLQPNQKKLQAKGIKSVRSRVMNCSEQAPSIHHAAVCDEIVRLFQQQYHSQAEVVVIDQSQMDIYPGLQARYDQLRSQEWLLGQTMPFSHQIEERFDWGGIDLRLHVKQAKIESAQVFSDCLYPDWIESVEQALTGVPYQFDAIEQALLTTVPAPHPEFVEDLKAIMLANIAG